MHEQLFKEIRRVEEDAERILSDAQKKSEAIIRNASNDAAEALSKKHAELKQARENELKQSLATAQEHRKKQLEKSSKEAGELRKAAEKKKETAAQLILERLSRKIGE